MGERRPAVCCPICNASADLVFADAQVFVIRASEKKVGVQLKAFRCHEAGHVFLIRSEDLATPIPHAKRKSVAASEPIALTSRTPTSG